MFRLSKLLDSRPLSLSLVHRLSFVSVAPTPAPFPSLEQTSLSFNALAPLFTMFARALFTDRSRLPFVAARPRPLRGIEGIDGFAAAAVSQVSSSAAARETKKKRTGRGGYERAVEHEEEIPGRVFSTVGVLRGRILTPLTAAERRRKDAGGREGRGMGTKWGRRAGDGKEKPLKLAFRRVHFSRHLYGPLTLAIR